MTSNNSQQNISLEQSLQAYRVMNTPTKFSWKQHWAQEVFSNDELFMCSEDEKKQFAKRLQECQITICDNIRQTTGAVCTLESLVNILTNEFNKNIAKTNRKVVYSTSNGERPIGKKAFKLWNGFQVIDMDIKDSTIATKLKRHIFHKLNKCNWFMGVALSSSGKGLHIYTKISIPQDSESDDRKKKLLYLTNFRHKYSFVYIATISAMDIFGFSKEDVLKWMDLSMFKPQQGAFIGYDEHPLINTRFFEDFIYVNFDNVEDIGHPDIDWVTYPDLKEIFKRWEWFEDGSDENVDIQITEAGDLEFDTHNKIHYKHFERWRLANTLVKIYGLEKGFKYLRMICSNDIKNKELQADCITASRHDKPVDIWAINRLNTQHGFKIKLNIQNDVDECDALFDTVDRINNPLSICESKFVKSYHITKHEYLSDIREQLLRDIGRVTLIEAGAGVGKTEMVKQLVKDGKKIMMVMPFTSTIKSKVENNKNWAYSYGGKQPNLDVNGGLSLTVDKFSHLNLMDIKTAGFDYIFIDESHLLFQSEYRPVMPKVVEMIRNTEVPIILMSGTPIGEIAFFPDIVHLKVIKDDTRKKKFDVFLVDTPNSLIYHAAKSMAKDIYNGRRILFPNNNGTLYSKQIEAAVNYFLQADYAVFNPVNLKYYKKSNTGEKFMSDVDFEKTIKDVQIMMASSFLSVGTDILDKYNFSIYFTDLMLPQEIEQYCNRLRNNDLYAKMYISKNDADGNSRSLHIYKNMNFKLNEEEIKNVHSILRLCNEMIERNPVEYKYNSLISSIIHNNSYIEYNDIENKYYLNEIAYKVVQFERKYREFAEQLPVIMRGMQCYGYEISAIDLNDFNCEGSENFKDLKNMMKLSREEQLNLNAKHCEELINLITDDRLELYKDVMKGLFEINKGDEWREDITNHKMIVKNIEVFEKIVPLFLSFSKQYEIADIKDIFEYCRNENGTFNFAALSRLRTLTNIVYNDDIKRLDLPIKDFMIESYKLSEKKTVKVSEIDSFIKNFAMRYALMASTNVIIISRAQLTMKTIEDIFSRIFRCLINVSRPTKSGNVDLSRIEILWKKKEFYNSTDHNSDVFILPEFLETNVDVINVDAPNVDTLNVDTLNVDAPNVDTLNVDIPNTDVKNI